MTHYHHHGHDHGHSHGSTPVLGRLAGALALTLGFAGVEAVAGWWSGSLALLSDAGHMLSDGGALALALAASWIARRPPSRRHTYGLVRAEVLAAFINALLMLLLVTAIVVEAVNRLLEPQEVAGAPVMVVAAIGLGINLVVLWMLGGAEGGINVRAAALHVMGDLLGSVAAVTAGAVIYFTGWTPIDPILSLVVAGLILVSTVNVVRGVLPILMEGVPAEVDLEALGQAMAEEEGVHGVHDLHVWTLSSGRLILSAHVDLADLADWPRVLGALRGKLQRRFGIDHVTLQPEVPLARRQANGATIPIFPTSRR
ncbi:MAG TPA: cation diffusion facilitator family transporter [Pelomicrobium sp.]|nr:cation diffusion facilitator family transporter [Pelomicrobium sp.]